MDLFLQMIRKTGIPVSRPQRLYRPSISENVLTWLSSFRDETMLKRCEKDRLGKAANGPEVKTF